MNCLMRGRVTALLGSMMAGLALLLQVGVPLVFGRKPFITEMARCMALANILMKRGSLIIRKNG